MSTRTKSEIIKVADEVWIATALLHQEHPNAADFNVEEIVARAKVAGLTDSIRPSVYVHAQMHCVANLEPQPNRYRMLYESAPGRRRLYRPGDPYDPRREGSKTVPDAEHIPEKYHHLLNWYANWSKSVTPKVDRFASLRALRGSGRGLYGDPDEYVRRLREGWE